jgi:hypothetical protein
MSNGTNLSSSETGALWRNDSMSDKSIFCLGPCFQKIARQDNRLRESYAITSEVPDGQVKVPTVNSLRGLVLRGRSNAGALHPPTRDQRA